MDTLLLIAAILLVILGVVGVVLPALPGTVLIFLGLLLAAWLDDFATVGVLPLVVIALLGAASYTVDFVAAAAGTRHAGASPRAAVGAALGTVAGFFFGLPGLLLGPFVGAVVAELTVHRDMTRAGKAGVAAWVGFVLGMGIKVGLAFAMIAVFLAARYVV